MEEDETVKKFALVCLLALMLCVGILGQSAQSELAKYFEEAYRVYPNIPRGILESMAYSASHFKNLQPTKVDEHHQPARYGLFALVRDGQGYFKNNLLEICEFAKVSEEEFLQSPYRQIMAVAAYLSYQAKLEEAASYEDFATVLRRLSEIPGDSTLNRYAQDLQLYEIYTNLQKGIETPEVKTEAVPVNMESIFGAENLMILSAPEVVIYEESSGKFRITNGEQIYGEATATTDYPNARWVPASPYNYSSRSGATITHIVIHTTQGSYAGAISWFQNPNARVSAHYVIRSSDGQVTQMVREYDKAWHIYMHNSYTIGIEHEGYVSDGSWYTTAMYQSSANLVRNITARRGINRATCYRGPAHSGVVVLPSSYQIKGHQHFPDQTHTDPGPYWNWYRYYDLVNGSSTPPSCNLPAPNGLAAIQISAAAATLSWNAVSGAASYTVRYRIQGSSSWITTNASSRSVRISGLTAGKIYEWQVRANCSSGFGVFSGSSYFATAQYHRISTACTGTFTDTGGPTGNYGNNENYIFTIDPPGNSRVTVDFYSFGLGSGDVLYIIDGPDVTSPVIGAYTGTNSPRRITSSGGAITFKFMSDGSDVAWGWRANWNCSSGSLLEELFLKSESPIKQK
jgi:N-acetyl-anhydromuramyl-L-alanine amidase AmpD